MVNHGLATGALFLLVGMVYERTHTRDLDQMGGLASGMPWLMGAFLFTAFASAGLPGLNGFVGEFLVIVGTFAVSNWFGALAATAVVLAAIYLLWSYQRMAFGPVREEHRLLPDVNLREVVVLAPVLALLLVFGVAPKLLTDRIDPASEAVIARVAPDPQHTTDVGSPVTELDHRRSGRAAVIGQAVLPTPELVFEPVLPELVLVAFAIAGLLYEALAKRAEPLVHLSIGLIGVALAAATSLSLWSWDGAATVLGGTVAADRFAVLARLLLLGVAALGLLLGYQYFARSGDEQKGEFTPLLLFATSGMTLIVAAADLIVTFLALEILSLSLYVLTGLTGRRAANEASMKYFLLGAFSSAFFLYGVAMAYGATGTTKIAAMALALTGGGETQALALLGFALLAVGFGFKVSAAPFHMWTPDVYQGAPTPVTAYMSAATKVAAFARPDPGAGRRVPGAGVGLGAGRVGHSRRSRSSSGSILAIAQTNVKRMLAYSSIAHAGFILTGLTAPGAAGIRSAVFYLVAYAAMTVGAFGTVMLVSGRGEERTRISDYAGPRPHRTRSPRRLMTLFLLSLAGIPPTAGFIAKVNVFSAAIGAGYWGLVLIGVLLSVAAAFFYLRVIVLMYMQEPEELSADPAIDGAGPA